MDECVTKQCRCCSRELPLSDFNKQRVAPDGLQKYCRACQKEKAHAYYQASPVKQQKRAQEYRRNPSGRGAFLQALSADEYQALARNERLARYKRNAKQRSAWAKANNLIRREHKRVIKKLYYERNKARLLEKSKAWRRRNRTRTKEWCRRYQARKAAAIVEKVDYHEIWLRDKGVCHICGLFVLPEAVHFDHIVALAKGGKHSVENIAVSHPWCNISKGTKPIESVTNKRK